jgi:hypothetical protein
MVALAIALLLTAPPGGHSHNDYEREQPLAGALEAGMTSVEADVFLDAGELRVAHERRQIRAGRTLESLYLDPLLARFKGAPIPERPLILLVDIKADGPAVYAVLSERLPRYAPILSEYIDGRVTRRHVTIVLSGARPLDILRAQTRRLAFVDGRLSDLDDSFAVELMPVVSDFWFSRFRWLGAGPMPENERKALVALADKAKSKGALLRFWAAPDGENAWRQLADAGVGLINTDRPAELGRFLSSRR